MELSHQTSLTEVSDDNTEILIKHEPLVNTRAWRIVQKKERRKSLGQDNSSNKLIHGQYTSRYNLHHTTSNDVIYRKRWREYSLHIPIPLFGHNQSTVAQQAETSCM